MRTVLCLAALAACTLAAAPAATAAYEELTFTEVLTDAQDHAGFTDMRSAAFAEPGDGTLVFRITFQDTTTAGGASNMVFFAAPDGTALSSGFDDTGAPTFNGNFDGVEPESCFLEGTAGYCVLPYASIPAVVGDSLTNMYAISYLGVAADCMPEIGPLAACTAAQLGGVGGYGSDYAITGCTKTGGCGPAGGPANVYENVTEAEFAVTKTVGAPSNDTFLFNWTAAGDAWDLAYDAEVEAGSVQVEVIDASGETVYTATVDETGTDGALLDDAEAGAWVVRYAFQGFQGSFGVAIEEADEQTSGTSSSQTGTGGTGTGGTGGSGSGTGAGTGTGGGGDDGKKKDSPGVAFPALLALLGLAAVAVRRRLA